MLTVAVGASVLIVVRAWRHASYAQLATASDHLDGRARYNIPAVPRPVEALLPSSGSACWGETRELGARRYHQSWATPDPPSPFPLCYPVSRKSHDVGESFPCVRACLHDWWAQRFSERQYGVRDSAIRIRTYVASRHQISDVSSDYRDLHLTQTCTLCTF